ncbi:hypothetical protein QR680_001655 [Steinernema hermaphroditum]|uniref:Nematode cuticle collagen N-terminal domain-containing protein n=1 Tax=Steinernema hermaphroditum TaxID=289476 RepID=A0AA39H0V3_9BILA|nr:hypothetical protein QR680_001655 [Steinernema hermaphroditum]
MRNLGTTTVALVSSSFSVFSTACLVYGLFFLLSSLNETVSMVISEVELFKAKTDEAWMELRDLRQLYEYDQRLFERENIFNSVFRSKRRSPFDLLPSWCQCEPLQISCPSGPPGPPGRPGRRGARGIPGPRGKDNFEAYETLMSGHQAALEFQVIEEDKEGVGNQASPVCIGLLEHQGLEDPWVMLALQVGQALQECEVPQASLRQRSLVEGDHQELKDVPGGPVKRGKMDAQDGMEFQVFKDLLVEGD